MTDSLISEYESLLYRKEQILSELPSLARGYISVKTIKGKKYLYLQSRVSGKLNSKYLQSDVVETITKQLVVRKQLEAEFPKVITRLEELELAAKLLDKGTRREVMLLKISAGMDRIDPAQKKRSASFACAMNSIEGIPVSDLAAQDLSEWQHGNKSFLNIFKSTLKRYGFAPEVR